MKQIKETRVYEVSNHINRSWFSRVDHIQEPIRCICVRTMAKFWHLDPKERIEIVLTNWNVADALTVNFGSYHIMEINGVLVASTQAQQFVIENFIRRNGKCFMYINVPDREGTRRALRI